MKTKKHFKSLVEIVKKKGLKAALRYDAIKTAMRHPKGAWNTAALYFRLTAAQFPLEISHDRGYFYAEPHEKWYGNIGFCWIKDPDVNKEIVLERSLDGEVDKKRLMYDLHLRKFMEIHPKIWQYERN